MSTTDNEANMLSPRQVSDLLGVKLNTLQKWRSRGIGPKYLKFGGSNAAAVRYDRRDVEQFIQARTMNPNR